MGLDQFEVESKGSILKSQLSSCGFGAAQNRSFPFIVIIIVLKDHTTIAWSSLNSMRVLVSNVTLLSEAADGEKTFTISVTDGVIDSIKDGSTSNPVDEYDTVIDGQGALLLPGLHGTALSR